MVAIQFHIGASGPVKAAAEPPSQSNSPNVAVPGQNSRFVTRFLFKKPDRSNKTAGLLPVSDWEQRSDREVRPPLKIQPALGSGVPERHKSRSSVGA